MAGASIRLLPTPDAALAFLRERGVSRLAADSRALQAGQGYLAWPGYARDPRAHVVAALAAGAGAVLVDAHGLDAWAAAGWDATRVAALPGLKAAAGPLADALLGQPSAALDVVAITGTNGKTSSAWWTAQLLSALGRPCGLIGTLGAGQPFDAAGALRTSVEPTGFTTPDPVRLQAALRGFADDGCRACAIEASSIGLDERRLDGLRIAVAAFTNFTRDHLDYHGSMDAYWAAKRRLFDWPGLRAAVVHVGDEQGHALAAELAAGPAATALDLWTVAVADSSQADAGQARLSARALQQGGDGLRFTLAERTPAGWVSVPVQTGLVGRFNVANLLGVVASARALGLPLEAAAEVCARLAPVPGRMQPVRLASGQAGQPLPLAIVDYAHTPDALEQALRALRPLAQARGGRLWCVFGCGGNRDATKRPLMGAIAHQQADRVVLTSDNPRDEAPCFILSQILAGIAGGRDEVDVIDDRAQAIAHALAQAAPADVVLIAGKGHETTQETAGVKQPFSDLDQALAALQRRAA
jgi:UDP-N-acetylmuramyl-tripeptide synthetase